MASPRQAEQVDITQFFSDSTTNLLQRAAQQALEWGSLDLTSEHLLYAALEDRVVRRVLEEVGADPEAIRAQLEEEAQKGGRTDVSPSLAPDAKRALLAAYEESRALAHQTTWGGCARRRHRWRGQGACELNTYP
jgi:ATP-dependent Clp protease ATP-binding subunit ClpC